METSAIYPETKPEYVFGRCPTESREIQPPKGGYIMSRIFFQPVEFNILYDLLEQICQKTEKHYIFNELAFRRMKFLKLHVPFLNTIVTRYQSSKQFYITRKQTFQTFFTIIKQLCHHNRIPITSKVQYFESTYLINYFIPYRCI